MRGGRVACKEGVGKRDARGVPKKTGEKLKRNCHEDMRDVNECSFRANGVCKSIRHVPGTNVGIEFDVVN